MTTDRPAACALEALAENVRAGMGIHLAAAEAGISERAILRCCPCVACYRSREEREANALSRPRIKAARQARSLVRADRRGQEWTSRELDIALDSAFSVQQAARMLGRTYHGVANKRARLRQESPEWAAAAQAGTRPSARRNGLAWTGPELEIAARDDLTAEQAARMLGRTYRAVAGQRAHMCHDPRKAFLAGLGKGRMDA
jgi:hypothetical protein